MTDFDNQNLRIAAMTLLLDTQSGGPATAQGLSPWLNNFNYSKAFLAADPQYEMVPGGSVGTPQLTIIDPRDMTVLLVQEGYNGSYPSILTQTAQTNRP